MRITFLYPEKKHLNEVDEIEPDENPNFFNVGKRVWIIQTYIFLKKAGYPVEISSTMPDKGIVFFHRSSLDYVKRNHSWTSSAMLVCIRSDKAPLPEADAEIVQNKHSANEERSFFVPHWPQPGLKPRPRERGGRVEVLSYKGADSHLHDSLKSDQWYNFIRQNDLQWRSDSLEWKGHDHFHSQLPWTDYSDVDVVIALRSDLSHHYPRKPASKLINAWMAGVPAILGPEIAFRELRESELDYIEVDSLEGVMKGVKRLKENENLYMNMVRNGKKRAKKFTRKKICKYWINKIKTIKDKYASRYLSLNVPMYYKKEVNPGKIFMRPIRLFENLIGF